MWFKKNSDVWFLGISLIVYLIITLFLSSIKPLWFDELCTFHISQLNIKEIYNSLGPMDPHPPLDKLFVSISQSIFGPTKFATRIPYIIFYLITVAVIFLICKKINGSIAARASSLLILISPIQFYSYEARSYGLVLMFSSILIYLWSKTPTKRLRNYVQIAIVTMGLISSHFYAVFIPLIIIISSFIIFLKTKKIDLKLWVSIIIGYLILIIYIPAIQDITTLSDNNWASPVLSRLIKAIKKTYIPFIIILLPIIVLNWEKCIKKMADLYKQNPAFILSLLILSMLVIIGYPLSFVLGAYHLRYFVVSSIPIVIISSIIMSTISRKHLFIAILFFVSYAPFKVANEVKGFIDDKTDISILENLMEDKPANAVVFMGDPHKFTMLQKRRSKKDKKDIHYLMDLDSENKLTNNRATNITLFELSKLKPGIFVHNINQIAKVDSTIYYLDTGTSRCAKKLLTLQKFKSSKIIKIKNRLKLIEIRP
mgnify:CR=1 FL=1|jgi:hypothetical protein